MKLHTLSSTRYQGRRTRSFLLVCIIASLASHTPAAVPAAAPMAATLSSADIQIRVQACSFPRIDQALRCLRKRMAQPGNRSSSAARLPRQHASPGIVVIEARPVHVRCAPCGVCLRVSNAASPAPMAMASSFEIRPDRTYHQDHKSESAGAMAAAGGQPSPRLASTTRRAHRIALHRERCRRSIRAGHASRHRCRRISLDRQVHYLCPSHEGASTRDYSCRDRLPIHRPHRARYNIRCRLLPNSPALALKKSFRVCARLPVTARIVSVTPRAPSSLRLSDDRKYFQRCDRRPAPKPPHWPVFTPTLTPLLPHSSIAHCSCDPFTLFYRVDSVYRRHNNLLYLPARPVDDDSIERCRRC